MLGNTGSYEGRVYSLAASTGIMAAGLGAASEIFQFRYAPGAGQTRIRVLNIQVSAAVDSTGFTAGAALFELVKATAWTVQGTGGTGISPTGKLRATQNTTLLAANDARVATTAALGAGTKTLDANAMGNLIGGAAGAGTAIIFPIPIYVDWAAYGIPFVLDNQEGFVIRATVPATGTWRAGVWVQYAEAD